MGGGLAGHDQIFADLEGGPRFGFLAPKGWAGDFMMICAVEGVEMAGGFDELPGAKAEKARVRNLLRRDRLDREVEARRTAARAELDRGRPVNITDASIGPTPEHAAKVPFEPYRVEKHEGTVRDVETVRRVSVNRVKQLHDRGVLTDDTYPACLWYQRQWEGCGFVLGATAASWGDQVRGDPDYRLGPKTPAQWESRRNFRFARKAIPYDMIGIFDLVVLEEFSIREAAQISKCRYSNAPKVVQAAALRLLGGIAHLLPVRAVGAPGSEPVATIAPVEGVPAGTFGEVDPIFVGPDGFLRPWDEIAVITRLRVAGVAEEDILAGLGDGQ